MLKTSHTPYEPHGSIQLLLASPEFQEWFGDSKVIDENENPLLVFHGSNARFKSFDAENIGAKAGKNRDAGFFGRGFYFSPHESLANKYGTYMYKCFLRAEKILTFDAFHCNTRSFDPETLPDEIRDEVLQKYGPLHNTRREEREKIEASKTELSGISSWGIITAPEEEYFEDILAEVFREVLTSQGYQGVKGLNPVSGEYEYTIFDPNNVFIFQVDIASLGEDNGVKESVRKLI